jgi:hypothetical protein
MRVKGFDRFELKARHFEHDVSTRCAAGMLCEHAFRKRRAEVCRRRTRRDLPRRNISPTSEVVVDLPLVPVIATMRPWQKRDASSSSPVIATPAFLAASSCGIGGTPGLSTIRLASVKISSGCSPSVACTDGAISAKSGPSWSAVRESVTWTLAPCSRQSFAAARPERPNPTTKTSRPERSNGLLKIRLPGD